ncbi:AAA family ATPase [Lactiplantibacillus plantarum]|uniref:AAA family ATPase n=1 Tax=Lactiplantibacillus plantarum TaxID=1590 RepID=UPI00077E3A09|nr:SMC family ATPase [Lactiplantibacillus plantarum]AMR19441.1 exonuclease SbcC [Lactiplantibacillus plantarum]QTL11973.1 SMC family ATPase [Lactiplantibacillus plantarum]WFB98690.1 SMC family ATPase [Lactiplantibacillus plantarum]
MKPVYLAMNYFGPHEHSIIDFSKLESTPIFLISGDTGAGKSTIFDAMTFALFGSTTNDGTDGRAAKEMRSQFAPADQPTSVTFYFEQGNQLYKIARSPEQYLAKKKGSGLTKKNSTAKLAVVDHVGGVEIESIATKPADVGPEITTILNLTADQFKKIILLPQNDFSEFLKSKTTDKEKILKKIFGTQLYSDFTAELKAEYQTASKTGDQFVADLRVALASATWNDAEQAQLQAVPDNQKIPLLRAFVTTRQSAFDQAQQTTSKINRSVKAAETTYQQARDRQQQFDRLTQAQADYQTKVEEQTPAITIAKQQLHALTWAQPLQATMQALTQQTRDQKQLTLDQQAAMDNVQQAQDDYRQAQAAVQQLHDQSEANHQHQQRLEQLATLIPQAQRVESLIAQLAKLKPSVADLKATFEQHQTVIKALTAKITTQQANLPSIDDLHATKDLLIKQREQFVDTLTPLDSQWRGAQQEQQRVTKQLTDLRAQLARDEQNQHNAQVQFEQQRGQRQSLMIAQLQQELVDGQPCVVCGSTDHSQMPVTTIVANEADLRQSMQAVDDAQNALAAANKQVEATQQRVEQAEKEVDQATQQVTTAQTQLTSTYQQLIETNGLALKSPYDLTAVRAFFAEQLATITKKLEAAQRVVQAIEKYTAELEAQQKQAQQTELQLGEQRALLRNKTADLTVAQAAIGTDLQVTSADLLAEKAHLNQIVATYQQRLESAQATVQTSQLTLSKHQTKLDDLNDRLKTTQSTRTQLEQTIAQALAAPEAPTHDQTVLENWLEELANGRLTALQVQIATYRQDKERLTTEIKQLQTALTNVERPNITGIQAQLADLQAHKDRALQSQTVAEQALTDAQSCLEKVQQIMHQQGTFAKRFAEITSLYNIMTGKDGNDHKLKLETYVVQNYLQRVLNYANDHFINLLSNNRYTFELAAEASDNRSDHGLDINVYDNETGNSRSSNTLSGGETFIAALSIALSLSEVVQSSANGVQIDALFVDEGFGSLDDETLEKAMQALETIGENRMVGVISHIESMKRTIGQQVLIKKMGDGRSTVRLISK